MVSYPLCSDRPLCASSAPCHHAEPSESEAWHLRQLSLFSFRCPRRRGRELAAPSFRVTYAPNEALVHGGIAKSMPMTGATEPFSMALMACRISETSERNFIRGAWQLRKLDFDGFPPSTLRKRDGHVSYGLLNPAGAPVAESSLTSRAPYHLARSKAFERP